MQTVPLFVTSSPTPIRVDMSPGRERSFVPTSPVAVAEGPFGRAFFSHPDTGVASIVGDELPTVTLELGSGRPHAPSALLPRLRAGVAGTVGGRDLHLHLVARTDHLWRTLCATVAGREFLLLAGGVLPRATLWADTSRLVAGFRVVGRGPHRLGAAASRLDAAVALALLPFVPILTYVPAGT